VTRELSVSLCVFGTPNFSGDFLTAASVKQYWQPCSASPAICFDARELPSRFDDLSIIGAQAATQKCLEISEIRLLASDGLHGFG
jgi:hypothetical protein